MENKITIGLTMFFLQLDSFVMKDQTKQIECRVSPIQIKWIFNYENESTKYLFNIWGAKFNKPKSDLFFTEIEAKAESEKRISNIRINIIWEEIKKEEPKQK